MIESVSVPKTENERPFRPFDNIRTWLLLIAFLILLGAAYIGQSSQAALTGQRVHDKQEQLDRIRQENAQLEADVAVLLAPSRIEARAKAIGLHLATPDQIKYLTVKDYPVEPAKPAIAAIKPNTDPHDSDPAVWWNNLLAQFGLSRSPSAAEATTNP